MCILQLREDGELCEVVRRHRRDVNRLELLAQLAYRSPHERPRANPRMLSIEVSPMPPSFITGNVYYKETVAEQLTLI